VLQSSPLEAHNVLAEPR